MLGLVASVVVVASQETISFRCIISNRREGVVNWEFRDYCFEKRAVMAEEEAKKPAVVVAMKGHPGSGKSTVARAIATALCCPLLDKDDVRDCTLPLERVDGLAVGMLNELSYAVLWRMAERQVQLGLSVVVDSPLSRRAHLDALTRLPGALVIVVECQPGNEEEWRRRLEKRGAAVPEDGGDGWHKPKTWTELERLRDGYQGCTDYEFGDVPRIVVDTTDPTANSEAISVRVVEFIGSILACDH